MVLLPSCPDVDPDNDQYGEPNSPDVDPSVNHPPPTPKPDSPAQNATPSVLQKLQKWGDYEAYGSVVQPSLFIPMKTPLSQAILDEWTLREAPKYSLTVSSLLQQQHFLHRQVGMIIDLSNHETLYADDLPPFIQYEHVQLVAKVFPDQSQVDQVIDLAEKYWAVNPTQHIAIHCAYGKPTGSCLSDGIVLAGVHANYSFKSTCMLSDVHSRILLDITKLFRVSQPQSSMPDIICGMLL